MQRQRGEASLYNKCPRRTAHHREGTEALVGGGVGRDSPPESTSRTLDARIATGQQGRTAPTEQSGNGVDVRWR